ncbi:MAG TPA: hypothetical protein VHM23_14490 [Actinomycetota bacterium]|nr:hypothetical protein [Actinomycetota bacterium]
MTEERQTGRVHAWVEGYVRAWSSNDPPPSATCSPRTRPTSPSPTVTPEVAVVQGTAT